MTEKTINAREALSSLVQDFKERLEADGEWGELGYEFPPEMPRYNPKALEEGYQHEVISHAPVSSAASPSAAPAQQPEKVQTPPTTETPIQATPLDKGPTDAAPPAVPVVPAPAPPRHSPPAPPQFGQAPKPGEGGTPALIQLSSKGADGLHQIREELGDCQRCTLHSGRNQLVFGEGASNARLMFVGEGPGAHEDQQGRPFVGPAGQLLDKMIVAMGFSREQVYIANVVKCRPPQNRDPAPEEKYQCRPFLVSQIEAVNPDFIVTLGKVATQTLLETDDRISRLRGRWAKHPHTGTRVMPTYHPAALLRNAHLKRPVWEDLQKVMGALREPSS